MLAPMKVHELALSTVVLSSLAVAQQPFPTDKTITLREDGVRYYVEGRVKIPSSVAVTSLRATHIEGRGEGAVIEVSGALEFKAVTGGEVSLENVWIELAPDAKNLYLSRCSFKSGGLRTAEGAPTSAKIFGENNRFENDARIELTVAAADIAIHGGSSRRPVVIRGAPLSDKSANKSRLFMLSWNGQENGRPKNLGGGLIVEGLADVLVRNCDVRGALTRFADCPKLEFDGNLVLTSNAEFEHSTYGRFGSTRIANSDFRLDGKLRLISPAQGKKAERLLLDHCWFGGPVEPAEITGPIVVDQTVDPSTGVLATYKKTAANPNGLAGKP
jgi:hypothetical protein